MRISQEVFFVYCTTFSWSLWSQLVTKANHINNIDVWGAKDRIKCPLGNFCHLFPFFSVGVSNVISRSQDIHQLLFSHVDSAGSLLSVLRWQDRGQPQSDVQHVRYGWQQGSGLPPGFQRIPILQYKCRVSCKISIYQNIWKIPIQSRGLSPENVIKIKSFMQIPIHIRCEL